MKSEGLTPAQLAERNAEYVTEISRLEKACAALAAENAGLKHAMAVTLEHVSVTDAGQAGVAAMIINDALHHSETPATDAFLAEIRAAARNEGINYTASRLAAAFNHGFINKSLREVFDVTRMILSRKKSWLMNRTRLMACPVNMRRNPLKNGRDKFAKELTSEEDDFCGGIADHYPTGAGFSSYCGIYRRDHGCCSCCELCEYRKPTVTACCQCISQCSPNRH